MKKIMSKRNVFINRDNNEKCAICLSECAKNSATLPCSHAFCMDCISNWWATNSTCLTVETPSPLSTIIEEKDYYSHKSLKTCYLNEKIL